jgi:hypothetical protein
MSEWQDISTAPKDGTLIWIYEAPRVYMVRWEASVPTPAFMEDDSGDSHFAATHWMPLPEPPHA